jgi:hypothetical protein
MCSMCNARAWHLLPSTHVQPGLTVFPLLPKYVYGNSHCLLLLLHLTAPTCLATWALLASMNACHCASFAAAARTASRCSKSWGRR